MKLIQKLTIEINTVSLQIAESMQTKQLNAQHYIVTLPTDYTKDLSFVHSVLVIGMAQLCSFVEILRSSPAVLNLNVQLWTHLLTELQKILLFRMCIVHYAIRINIKI